MGADSSSNIMVKIERKGTLQVKLLNVLEFNSTRFIDCIEEKLI